MSHSDIIEAFLPVKNAFEQLKIDYYIGGSVASSAYGMARATIDIDCVSTLSQDKINEFVEKLKDKYYIDESMITEAIQSKTSFNLIHTSTMLKVDIFICGGDPYGKMIFKRRIEDTLEEASSIKFFLASPEDVILSKLDWYKKGGQVSQKQWKDIQGVINVQREKLNLTYLNEWAEKCDLLDLLNKVLKSTY